MSTQIKIRCPSCGYPGANVSIWGSADLSPDGLAFYGDMKDMNVNYKDGLKCLNVDNCDFEGFETDFTVKEVNQNER